MDTGAVRRMAKPLSGCFLEKNIDILYKIAKENVEFRESFSKLTSKEKEEYIKELKKTNSDNKEKGNGNLKK